MRHNNNNTTTMAMTSLKRQRRKPFEMLLLLKVLIFSCMLLAATVLGEENVVSNGECESGNEGNDSEQCIAATNANANSGGEKVEDANAEGEVSPWYRNLSECKDYSETCDRRAEKNDCARVPERYLKLCPKACKMCDNISGEYISNCYGEDQHVAGDRAEETALRVREVEDYMLGEVFVDEKYAQIRADCKNRDKECSFWAVIGECEANPKYMTIQCSPACMTCEQLDFNVRCPFDKDAPTVWGPGGLNAMFQKIVASPANEQYNVTIHSSPASYKDHEGDDGPWVITLDDFLSPAECEQLIQLGHDIEYTRSEDVGAKRFDGTYDPIVSKDRTSTTAWCVDDCFKDPVAIAVRERIEELTGIPDANSEYLQLLRYEVTQRYNVHHDYIPFHRERAQGVRILTVFLYLADVEAGGGTNFPRLDLTVMPKQGRVLIWPSVKDSLPDRKDPRTDHQALPVEAGIKYSANGWIHARDFKTPFEASCQ